MAAVEQRLPHGLLSPPLGKSSLSLTLHLARQGRFQAVEISGGKLSSSKDEKSEELSALMQRLRTKSAQIKSWSDTSKLVRSAMVWTSLNDKRAVDNMDHSRLRKCINALQKALKVTTLPSMVERLDSVARQVGLNFKVSSSGHECCISAELFYVEIRLDTSGRVQDVRVAHHGSESQSCPEMLRVLRNGDFKEFVGHLKGLLNIYRIPGDSKIKMRTYQTLLCMESDLTKMADAYNRMSGGRGDPMTQIQKGIVGYVIPRQGGHPMQLKCFISPYDMLNVEGDKSETIREHVPRDVGQSVNVALEGSTSHKLQTQPLFAGINPPQHDSKGSVGTPAFAGINNNNMMLLPACFSLVPPSPIPLSLSTIKRIHSATGILCGDETKAVPMNRLVTQNVMEAKGIADMDNNNGRNKLFHVTLPDQHHCYYINDSPDLKGVLVSKIPFTHPACVPRVLEALRQQTVYNTLITSCVRKGCEEAKENAQLFEVNTTSPTGISVTFEHPVQESMACLEIDLADPNHVKCKVHIPAGDAPVCTDEYATMIMNRCLSIPVLMRAIARHAVAHHKEMQRQINTTSPGILSSLSKATEGIVMSHGFSDFAAVTSSGLKITAVKDGGEQKLSNANLNLLGVTSPNGGGGKSGGTLLMHLNGVDPSQGNDFGGAAAQYRQASVSPFTLASTTTGRGAQAELQFTDTDATKVSENPMLASLLKGSIQGPPHSKNHPMLMNLLKEPVGVPPQPGQLSPRGTEPPPPAKQRKRKRKSTTDNRSPKRQQSEEEFTKELNAMDFDSNIPYDATLQADHLTPTTPHPSTPTVQSPARAFPPPPSHSMQLKPSLDPSGRGEAVKDFTQDSEVTAMLNDIAEQSERLKRQGSRDGANSRLGPDNLPPLDATSFIRTDSSMEDLTAAGAVAQGSDLQASFDPADFVAGESTPGTDHLDTDYTFPTEPIEFNTEVLNTTDTSFVDSLIEESSEGNVSMDVESCDANAFGLALNPSSVASKITTSGAGSSDVSGKSQAAAEVGNEGSVNSNVGSALSASSFDQGPYSSSDLQGLDLSMTAASTPEVLDLSTGHHTPLDQQTEPTDLSTSQKSSSSTSLQQLEPTDLSTSLKLPSANPPSSTAASAASVPSSSAATSSASITQQSTGSLKITVSLGNNTASIKSGKSDSEGSRSDSSTKMTKRRSSSRSSADGSNGAEGSGKRSRAGDKKDKGSKRRRSEAGVSPPRAAGVGPNGSRTPPVSKTFTPPYSTSPARSYTPPASLPGASSQLPMTTQTARSHTPPASMQSSRSGSGGKPAAMLSLQAKTVGAIGKSGSLGGGKPLSGTGSASPMRTKALSKSLSEGSGGSKGGQSPRSKLQVSGSGSKSSSSKDKPSRIMITISRHPSASSSYTATLRNAKTESVSKSSSSKAASSKGADQVRASTPTTSGPKPVSSSPKVSTPTSKPVTSGPKTVSPVPKPVPGTTKTVTPGSKMSSSGLKVASSIPKVAGPTSKPLASVSKSVTQSATPGPKTSTSAPKPVTSGSKTLVSGPKAASVGSKTSSSALKQPSASAKSATSSSKLVSSQSSKSQASTSSSSANVASKVSLSSASKVSTSSKSSTSLSSVSSKAASTGLVTASANTSVSTKTSTAPKETSSKQSSSSSKTKTSAALPKMAQETSHAATRPAPLVISTAPATSPTVKSTVSPRATLSSPPLSRSNSKSPIRSRKGSLSAVIDKLKNTASSVHVSSISDNDSVVLVSTAHVSPTTQASAAENPQVSTVSYGHTSNGIPEIPAIKTDVKTTKDAVKSKSSNVVTVAKAEIAVKALTTTAAITNGAVSNASDRMNSEHVTERREKSVSPTTTRQDESSETPPPLLKPQEIDPQTSLSACVSDSVARSVAEASEDASVVTEIPSEDSSSRPASAESKTTGERPRSRGEDKSASLVSTANGTTEERSGKKRSSTTVEERLGNQNRSKSKPPAEPQGSAPATAAMPALTAGTQLNASALSSLVSYGDESSSSPQETSPNRAQDPEPPILEPYGKTDSPADGPTLVNVGQDDLHSLSPDGNLVIDVPGAANAHTSAPLPPATHSPDHDHSMDPEVDSQAENTSPLSDPDQSHLLYEGTSDQSQPDASPCDIDDDLMDEALIGGMDS